MYLLYLQIMLNMLNCPHMDEVVTLTMTVTYTVVTTYAYNKWLNLSHIVSSTNSKIFDAGQTSSL